MTYNLTAIGENSTSLLGFIQSVNSELTGSLLGIGFLVVLFALIIINVNMKTFSFGRSMVAASFITFVLSVLFRAINLINDFALYGFMILLGVSLAFSWLGACFLF